MATHLLSRQSPAPGASCRWISSPDYVVSHGLDCRKGQEDHIREGLESKSWFNVRNRYGFINRADSKEDIMQPQRASRKSLHLKVLERLVFNFVERENG
jgi:hypothetical protein